MDIRLCDMTRELARSYFRAFVLDPDLFLDKSQYQPYEFSEEKSDRVVERYQKLGRKYMAVMLEDDPIGEVVLKDMDAAKKCCTLGISMRSDEFKNKGYGTEAELLTLKYAFTQLGMETVLADALITNTRSQRVLEKAGFMEIRRDDSFVYYKCEKASWIASK